LRVIHVSLEAPVVPKLTIGVSGARNCLLGSIQKGRKPISNFHFTPIWII
jgi:hypothetical protein